MTILSLFFHIYLRMNFFKKLQKEHKLRESSTIVTNKLWEENRRNVLLMNKIDDVKNLEIAFLQMVKFAMYEHFKKPENAFEYSSDIVVELGELYFQIEPVEGEMFPAVDKHKKLVQDFLGLPDDIETYDDHEFIRFNKCLIPHRKICVIQLMINKFLLEKSIEKRKSILTIQNWMRKCLYEPGRGLRYKVACQRAIEYGLQP